MNTGVHIETMTEGAKTYEVLHPPNTLRAKVRVREVAADDAVAQAEKALAGLAGNFVAWMVEAIDALSIARDKALAGGFTPDATQAIHRAAHDLRGQAATLGFPLAGRLGDSLCRLIDGVPPATLPATLVSQHVDAIRAIVAENAQGEGSPVARRLVERLTEVAAEFVSDHRVSQR